MSFSNIISDISYHFTKFELKTQLVQEQIKKQIIWRGGMDQLVNSNIEHIIALWVI